MEKLVNLVENEFKRTLAEFRVGDTVKVWFKIIENPIEKKGEPVVRVQPFEGVVIRYRGEGLSKTFTVRKVSFGIGVERGFPLYSPRIEKIEIVKTGRVRRAKLYYLRKAVGRAARIESEMFKETTDKSVMENSVVDEHSSVTEEKKKERGDYLKQSS